MRPTLAALAMLALVAACGGQTLGIPTPPAASSGPTGNTSLPPAGGSTDASAGIDACALLTDDEVEAGTGEAVDSREHSTLTRVFPSVCDIGLEGGSVFGGAGSLTVEVMTTGGKQMYETSFEPFIGQNDFLLVEAVPGLGDKAGRSDDEIMVLKGDVLFDVFYVEYGRKDKLEVVRYLAEIILGKLACIASGCPGMTVPPPLNTHQPSATPVSLLGGQLTPANERFRVVNLYADDSGPVDLDVYGWDQTVHASLLATVPYGQVSEFFDPGIGTDDLGIDSGPHTSFVRHGDELVLYSFNLADVDLDPEPGAVVTILAAPGDEFAGTRELGANYLYEDRQGGYPIASPVADGAILRVMPDALTYTGDARYFYLSVGAGCLAMPDFPTVPVRVGGGLSAEGQHESADGTALVPAGKWTLTAHPDTGASDPRCDNDAAAPGVPIQVANGQRIFLFPYRAPGDPQLKTLVLPFADDSGS
jgi:hypothetical protein